MTKMEYNQKVYDTAVEYPDWRWGQTYFNVLAEVRGDIAEQVRGTQLDPYYSDGVIPEFLHFVSENW